MKKSIRILLFIWILTVLNAQDIPKRIYEAVRLTGPAPEIDGRLDDACWTEGKWMGDFIQQQPNEGQPGTQKTEFKILYDDHALYAAMVAHETDPGKMDIRISRRDEFAGDCAGFCFDSYYDHRTGYEFNLTSGGTKIDLIQMDTGAEWFFDQNWDAVWDGKTAVTDSAWTLEMRIPFSQLRFSEKEEQVWGLHIWRWIQREMEESQFQLIPLDSQGRVHRFGILKGIRNIPSPRRIELLPYTRASLNRFKPETGNPFRKSGEKWSGGLGLDGRIGLSANINLDFTVNPDFGQVEADPSQVNLTAFETFYEEKRPFFMEGRQVLDFDVDGQSLFYSRRIGRSPQLGPQLAGHESADLPESTTILGAAKISGKTAGGWSVGALSSVTSEETARIRGDNGSRQETVEPLTHYGVLRLQRDFHEGNHSLGLMMTAVNRDEGGNNLHVLPRAAYAGGFDGTVQWGDRTYFLNAKTVFSHIRGSRGAMLQLQQSPVHYYQRTDAGHISVDSSCTSLSGTGGELEIGKGGNGHWMYEERVTWRSPGFDLNDAGYIQQADLITQESEISYMMNDPTEHFSSYYWYIRQYNRWNFDRKYLLAGYEAYGRWSFKNYWSFHGFVIHERNRRHTRLLRGGPMMALPDATWLHYHLNSDSRKRMTYGLALTHTVYNDDDSRYWTVWTDLSARASDRLEFSFSPQYEMNRDGWQYVGLTSYSGEKPYLLARIDQETLRLTLRMNYYITPDVSIQYYGQPFISAGHYAGFKRVVDATASRYQDRAVKLDDGQMSSDPESAAITVDEDGNGTADYMFHDPDFNFREFHSNLVLRWEYRPGSTLYVVWTHGRSQSVRNGEFDFGHDMNELFRIFPDNVYLVKLNYWFSL
ncbi:carbohydrate binding family 9 domain-containing protein [bacterium]|nr:carbohydrate binding family 9 domain-containing protein [bacterium]